MMLNHVGILDEPMKNSTITMATKIGAAQMVTESGCDMVIINGNKPDKLYDIVEGKSAGTLFRAIR